MFKKKKKEEVDYETEFDAQYDTGAHNLSQEQRDAMMNTINYKFNEAKLINEFKEYVDATYGQHYAKDKFQATEFIVDGGHGIGFCLGNVMKYAQRYGKKGTRDDARKDLLKVLHYALIGLYVHDTDEQE